MMLCAQKMPMQHERPGMVGEPDGLFGIEQLDLTDAQKDQLHKVRIDFKKKQIKLHADMELADIDLQEMIANNESGKKLDAAIDKVAGLKSELFKERISQRIAIRKILTDEQRAELKKLRRAGKRKMFGKRMKCKDDCGKDEETVKPGPGHPIHREG